MKNRANGQAEGKSTLTKMKFDLTLPQPEIGKKLQKIYHFTSMLYSSNMAVIYMLHLLFSKVPSIFKNIKYTVINKKYSE